MSITIYPVKFEAYDELNQLVYTVKTFDECAVEVEIKTLMDEELWKETSKSILKCIKAMKLDK